MTVGLIIEGGRDIVTVQSGTGLKEAVSLLSINRIGAMPVMRGDEVVGVISERDLIRCLAEQGPSVLEHRVEDVMTSPAITVSRDTSVLAALALMTERRIRHLPVVEAGRLVGIVSIGDLVKFRIDSIEREAAAMRDYIASV